MIYISIWRRRRWWWRLRLWK